MRAASSGVSFGDDVAGARVSSARAAARKPAAHAPATSPRDASARWSATSAATPATASDARRFVSLADDVISSSATIAAGEEGSLDALLTPPPTPRRTTTCVARMWGVERARRLADPFSTRGWRRRLGEGGRLRGVRRRRSSPWFAWVPGSTARAPSPCPSFARRRRRTGRSRRAPPRARRRSRRRSPRDDSQSSRRSRGGTRTRTRRRGGARDGAGWGRRFSRAPTGRVLAAARTTGSDPTEASADGAGVGRAAFLGEERERGGRDGRVRGGGVGPPLRGDAGGPEVFRREDRPVLGHRQEVTRRRVLLLLALGCALQLLPAALLPLELAHAHARGASGARNGRPPTVQTCRERPR